VSLSETGGKRKWIPFIKRKECSYGYSIMKDDNNNKITTLIISSNKKHINNNNKLIINKRNGMSC